VPSQETIYNKMLEDSSKKQTSGVEESAVTVFLNEGIKIQAEQWVGKLFFEGEI
jgi:hypothetical protein